MNQNSTIDLTPTPVSPKSRLEVLDVLRGFAVLGILFMNMLSYSGAFGGDWSAFDQTVMHLIRFLIEAKFYSLFSFLFGLGVALQMLRAEARGTPFTSLYFRRLFILLLLGFLHAYFIWSGDILVSYALLGVLLYFYRRRSDKLLLISAAICLLVPIWLSTPAGEQTVGELYQAATASIRPAVQAGRGVYVKGTYWEITAQRFRETTFYQLSLVYTLWIILAMFLLGLYAGRRQILADIAGALPFWRRVMIGGLVVGLLFNGLYVFFSSPDQFPFLAVMAAWIPAEFSETFRRGARSFGAPALCLFYISAIGLLYQTQRGRRFLGALAPVGRMALSNYLAQSIIATLIFYSYGLGLYGAFGPAGATILTVLILAVQIPVSHWWLERYRFGPAEWLWRSLTYGRLQPLRFDDVAGEGIVPAKNKVLLAGLSLLVLVGFGLWRAWQAMPKADQAELVRNLANVRPAPTATPVFQTAVRSQAFIVATPIVEPVSRPAGVAARTGDLWHLGLAFDVEMALAEIETLTGPPYLGRLAGSAAGEATADYIARRFADYGLQPAGLEGTFFQPFPLIYTALTDTPQLIVTDATGRQADYHFRQDYTTIVTRYMGAGAVEAAVVWANNCARDDFDAVDVVDKVVLCWDERWLSRQDDVGRIALEHGAAGLLLLSDPVASPLDRIGPRREVWVPEPIPTFRIAPTVAEDLLTGAGLSVDDLTIAFASFPLSTTARLDVSLSVNAEAQGRNVLGVLPGRDPHYAHEVVILGGHFDHMGQDPDGAAWLGANDNASGIAALLEIARSWQEQGYVPRRTVLFAAWDAEEMGLLGSQHYVAQPRYPLTQTVGMLQLDMVGAGEETLYLDGRGTLTPKLQTIAQTLAISTVNTDFGRSDHVPFLAAGVPATMLIWFGGHETAATAHYHRPLDTMAVIEPDKLNAAGRLVNLTALALAEGEPTILDLLQTRVTAVKEANLTTFLQTGTATRQAADRAWFRRLHNMDLADFDMAATDLVVAGNVATATVRMTAAVMQAGEIERHLATLPVRFRHQADGWRWDGPALISLQIDPRLEPRLEALTLAYPPGQGEAAVELARLVAARYADVAGRLGLPPGPQATLQLYSHSQALRADSDPTLPTDVTLLVETGLANNAGKPLVRLVYSPAVSDSLALSQLIGQLALAEAGMTEASAPWLWQGLPLALAAVEHPLAIQAEYLPPLAAALATTGPASPVDPAQERAFSWAAVESLQQAVGWSGIGRIAAALGEGKTADAALQEAIGLDTAGFNAFWRAAWQERLKQADEGLNALLTTRQAAIVGGDEAAFLATVARAEPTLLAEQAAWFAGLATNPVETFQVSGRPLAFLAGDELLAEVTATYAPAGGRERTTAPIRVRLVPTSSGYRWAGALFDTLQSDHFTIHYPAGQKQVAQDVRAEVEAIYAQVTADLGIEIPQKLTLKLYDDAGAFRASIAFPATFPASSAPPGQGDYWTQPGQSLKHLISPQDSMADHRQAIAQALTQYFLFAFNVQADWLREGLAIYEAGRLSQADAEQIAAHYQPTLIRAVDKGQLFSIADWPAAHSRAEPLSEAEAQIAAAQSWDMVRYLIDVYELDKLQLLLGRLAAEQNQEAAFQAVFALSVADFETAWQESVARGHAAPEWGTLAQTFDALQVEAHIAELSGPDYAGRQAGLAGEAAAADYIAARFAAYGLKPGGDDETFFQSFPITYPVLSGPPQLLPLNRAGEPLTALVYRKDFLVVQQGAAGGGEVMADLIWIRGEDYGAMRLSGQIVLRKPTGELDWEINQAIAHGAGGLILVGERTELGLLAKELAPNRTGLLAGETIPVVEVTNDGLEHLLAGSAFRVTDLNQSPPALSLDFQARLVVPLNLEALTSANVLGLLPGADPDLRHEVVIVSAHYDHVGDDAPDRVCLANGDCLALPGFNYPGANNNASGVGVLLEMARLWQAGGYRPSRSVLFAAWGAHELETAGSRFYIQHPTMPLTRTTAAFILESVGGGDGFYLQAQGRPDREAGLRFAINAAAGQVDGRLDLVNSNRPGDQLPFRAAGAPAMLIYWEEADEVSYPDTFANEIDPRRLEATGQMVTLAVMTLAR